VLLPVVTVLMEQVDPAWMPKERESLKLWDDAQLNEVDVEA
jgi:hypothetical protein